MLTHLTYYVTGYCLVHFLAQPRDRQSRLNSTVIQQTVQQLVLRGFRHTFVQLCLIHPHHCHSVWGAHRKGHFINQGCRVSAKSPVQLQLKTTQSWTEKIPTPPSSQYLSIQTLTVELNIYSHRVFVFKTTPNLAFLWLSVLSVALPSQMMFITWAWDSVRTFPKVFLLQFPSYIIDLWSSIFAIHCSLKSFLVFQQHFRWFVTRELGHFL